MVNEYEIKKQICDIGKRIYNRNMVAANDGNISVKLNDHEFLCTPTGVSKGFMTPDYICKVDENGNVIQANAGFRPSSEIKMHMRVYQKRPDVGSVVHAHPVYATSFAIAGIPLTQPIMPEAVIALGCVPIAEYGTPSTNEIPDRLEKYLPYYNSFAEWVGRDEGPDQDGGPFVISRTEYPIPFGSNDDLRMDAEAYYTLLKAAKGFDSPVWKVAVNEERRKEFNCEWCLRPDMQKSGYMADHVAHNYPKRDVENLKDVPWTNRAYDYNDLKMDMPIPQDELIKNPLCDQNPAYLGN